MKYYGACIGTYPAVGACGCLPRTLYNTVVSIAFSVLYIFKEMIIQSCVQGHYCVFHRIRHAVVNKLFGFQYVYITCMYFSSSLFIHYVGQDLRHVQRSIQSSCRGLSPSWTSTIQSGRVHCQDASNDNNQTV